MGSKKVKAPPPRSYLGEMQSALSAQGGIQSQLLGLEAQYVPQWQAQQQQNLMGQMGVLGNLYGSAIPQSQALQGQLLASQGNLYSQVGGYARNAYNATLDPTTAGLYSTMASQAAQGLANGRNLSDQETRMGQGAARAAMAARGMQMGNQAIAAEVLNSYNLGQAREDRARAFAGNVYGAGQQNATQAMSMYGQPLMSQMNQFSAPALLGQSQQMYGDLGSKMFQPESQYNASLISANRQEEMQAQIANAQASAGLMGGVLGAVGSIGGAMLGGPMGMALGNKLFGTSTPTPSNGAWSYSGGSPTSVTANMGGRQVNLSPQGYVIP